ncbi:hypothetical protein GCM10009864_60310 [Streptomyces lunalinharesii]|uniref:Uncharacterized protein n=1 Tax=Streptomyces lunalinharesii TaxID=333384 RepID=A0ABP6F4S3_9ACTN
MGPGHASAGTQLECGQAGFVLAESRGEQYVQVRLRFIRAWRRLVHGNTTTPADGRGPSAGVVPSTGAFGTVAAHAGQ